VSIELTMALNVGDWLVIQLGLAWAFTKMPVAWFKSSPPRAWEHGGRFYEKVFAIKRWKDYLPDAARWFTGGFAKGELAGKGADYWQRFIRETRRGECVTGAPSVARRCSSFGIRGGVT
jgi:glycosyl-4,4'-diaponeurosporenoate acyltransferase